MRGREKYKYGGLDIHVFLRNMNLLLVRDAKFFPATFSETEGSSRSGLRNADLLGVREGLSQSRLRYSRAVRTPRRADLFENPRKWHVSPVVRRLATLYTPRRCLSPSHHPTPSHYHARSLLFPRASNVSADLLTLPVRFRYSRSKFPVASWSQFSVLSRAPI